MPRPSLRPAARALLWLATVGLASAFWACGDKPPPPDQAPRASRTYDTDGALLVPFQRPASLPNLLFVMVDTLRADAVGDGAGKPGNMPWLAGLAQRGTLATQASSNAPWTPPSLTSMLTGLAPFVHGCRGEEGGFSFPPGRTTYAEVLSRAHGYETAIFMGASSAAQVLPGSSPSVFAGFQSMAPGFLLQGLEKQVGPWAARRDRSKPFFLFLHTFEAHHPYGAANHPYPPLSNTALPTSNDLVAALGPEPSAKDLAVLTLTSQQGGMWLRSRHSALFQPAVPRYWWSGLKKEPDPDVVNRLRQAYDGGTTWVDGLLERATQQLRALGLLENTLLVITADHGEAFGEHGLLMHGRGCHDELLHVPLVLTGMAPFDGGKRLEASVSPQDVLPTFLDLVGLPALDDVEGRSFLPLMRTPGPGRPVLAEEWVTPTKTGGEGHLFLSSVRSARWKVIVERDLVSGETREQVYDLVKDPGEKDDLKVVPAAQLDEPFRAALDVARQRARDFRAVR